MLPFMSSPLPLPLSEPESRGEICSWWERARLGLRAVGLAQVKEVLGGIWVGGGAGELRC